MANEFKIKKGLIVTGATGGTALDVQGSQGQLFSVTDDLSGSIFAVSDISGVPILDVNSSGLSTFDGDVNLPDSKKILLGTGNDFQLYHDGTHGVLNNTTGNLYTSALGSIIFRTSLNVTALTLDTSQNATFAGDVDVNGEIVQTSTGNENSFSSELNMNSNKINSLANPTTAQDAATKAYVDNAIAGVPQGDITAVTAGTGLTGGGTSGAVTLNAIGGDGITANANDLAVDSTVARKYVGTATGINNTAYKTAFTVNGGTLSSHIRFTVQGTTGSVVVSNLIDLAVNHHQDIQIKALSGNYTLLSVKVISNDNEDFEVQLKTNSANPAILHLEVFPLGSETVTFTSTSSFTGATGIFDNIPYGNYMSGRGGDEGDLFIGGNLTVENGNVGIGTTSPGAKLDVKDGSSAMRFQEYSNGASLFLDGADGDFIGGDYFNISAYGATDLAFGYGAATKMVMKSTGNVGIGTTSPAGALSVENTGTAGVPVLDIINTSTSTFNHSVEVMTPNMTTGQNNIFVIGRVGSTKNSGYIGYKYSGTAGSNANVLTFGHWGSDNLMNIDGLGNVGIGTTSPIGKLTVQGDDADIYLRSNDYTIARIINRGSTGTNLDTGLFSLFVQNTENVRIDAGGYSWLNGGNVGIGTTSPSKKLEVNGSFKLGTNSYIEYGGVYPYTITTANTASVGNLVFSAGLGSAAYESKIDLQGTNTAGVAGITLSTASTARMVVTADGDVGIGTTTPLAKLDIQGTQGQLFSVTDDLSGDIFSVADISGVPIMNVNSDGTSYFDGNVGIGTTSSSVPLAVEGVASMGSNSRLSMGILDINSNSTPTQILIQTTIPWNSAYADFTVNIKGFVYGTDESCNLSIHWHYYNNVPYNANITSSGSWAPIAKLHSSDATTPANGFVQIHLLSPGYWPKLYVESMYSSAYNDAYASGWSWSDAAGTGTAYALDYNKDFGNNFVMTDPGNVGIGTTSPGAKLDVNGPVVSRGGSYSALNETKTDVAIAVPQNNKIYSETSMGYQRNLIYHDASGSIQIGQDGTALITDIIMKPGTTGNVVFRTNSNSETARIASNGNVGIGTTNPSAKLDVDGDIIISDSGDRVFATDSLNGAFELGDIGGLNDEAVIQGDGTFIFLKNAGNTTLTTTVNNRVGIGTSGPGSKLDILGATNTSNSSLLRVRTTDNPNAPEKVVGFYVNTNTERGFISVNQYATAYSTSSDYRLKENIVPISNSIERLKELKPCRFNFIQGDPNYVVDGFIAHEAAEVIPEAVTGEKDAIDEDNNPLYQGIDQSKVVPLLTAALQEAISKIEQLETRIQILENN